MKFSITKILISAVFATNMASVALAQAQMECLEPKTGKTTMRIVNGDRAQPRQWPFIVGHVQKATNARLAAAR